MAPPSPTATLAQPGSAAPSAAERLVFTDVYKAYFDFVWRCLRGLGVSASAVDDAAQEVFVVVHRRLAEFRAESSLRTWLYGIVRNVAQNHRRGLRRKPEHGDPEPVLQAAGSGGPSPLDSAQDKQAAEFVERFVQQLDDKKREVFVLCLLEGWSAPELAEALGIPLNTAYTRMRAARLEFRAALERRGGKP